MKINECPSISHDCATFESVRKYIFHLLLKNHQSTREDVGNKHMDFQNLEDDNTPPKK